MMTEIDRISEALQYIDTSDRDKWVRMGMAIKSELGDPGFDLWLEWSQQADSFNSKDARDVWRSIRADGKVTIGSLFHAAKAGGWRDDGRHQKSTEEAITKRKHIAAKRVVQEGAEIDRERANTAAKANALWDAATDVKPDHSYLACKGIPPVATLREIDANQAEVILGYAPKAGGKQLSGRLLVVPVRQGHQLSTLELIDADKRKTALAGRGSKTGGFWTTEHLPDGDGAGLTLLIGEGVATTLSASMATRAIGIAALSANNLLAVAKAVRERYPMAKLVILADLVKANGAPDPHAIRAAKAVGGKLAIPDFGPVRPEGATDFNDLHQVQGQGLEAVARCIDAASKGEMVEREVMPEMDSEPAMASSTENETNPIDGDVISCDYGNGFFEVSHRGVFFIGSDKGGDAHAPRWICSPLSVVAMTRDTKSGEWGRLLEWRDADQVLHQWTMPMELLQGDGSDVFRNLARQGLSIAPHRAARDLLAAYLQVWPVQVRARCVDRLGWQGATYVTPKESIGQGDEIVVFQNAQALEPAFAVSGTAEEWRHAVAALAAGNSRLVFSLCASFAGPLIDVVGEDSGGFHLRGGSSSGKSTALKVAASVWGNPATYPRQWRATTNGLEGLAALHNDGLLILDELSQCEPKEAGDSVYTLANGQGKARASRTGTARQPARWQVMTLSAGEVSLATLMAQAGKKINAGQEIRLADIEADAGAGMGLFEELHDQPSPAAMALALKDAASLCHGAVGVEWLRCIVADRPTLAEVITDGIRQFVEEVVPADAAGQVLRVARRFGLAAVAGELATHYGLTGWPEGEADKAARQCFAAWLESFGSTGNREEHAILSQVKAFFEAHGASRFEDAKTAGEQRIPNRAGFYRTNASGARELMVLPEAFKRDICQGYDAKEVTKVLLSAGWLQPGNDGNSTQKPRVPGHGTPRCYIFTGRMWEGQ